MNERLGYYHPDLGDDPQIDTFAGADVALAKGIEHFLLTNYPRQAKRFQAEINHAQGIVTLGLPSLMGPINVFVLHIERLKNYNTFVADMHRACGELLERYRLPRDRHFSLDRFAEAKSKVPLIGLKDAPVPE